MRSFEPAVFKGGEHTSVDRKMGRRSEGRAPLSSKLSMSRPGFDASTSPHSLQTSTAQTLIQTSSHQDVGRTLCSTERALFNLNLCYRLPLALHGDDFRTSRRQLSWRGIVSFRRTEFYKPGCVKTLINYELG